MKKIVASGLAIVAVGVAAFLLTKTKTSTPPVSRTVSDGVVITALQREVSDAERLMEARFWEFTAEMPDHKHSLETTLELRRNGKLVRYLASSTFGPVVRPVSGDSKTQNVLVGLYPPSGSWDSGKVKAFAGRKTRGSLSGSMPKNFLFPVAQSGVAWGDAVYDQQKKAFLLMVIGGVKHRNVIWPSPQRDDYALYLKVKKIYLHFSKNGS